MLAYTSMGDIICLLHTHPPRASTFLRSPSSVLLATIPISLTPPPFFDARRWPPPDLCSPWPNHHLVAHDNEENGGECNAHWVRPEQDRHLARNRCGGGVAT